MLLDTEPGLVFVHSDAFLITAIIGAAFFIRALPRLLLPNALASDTYFHLYRARTIRDNGFRLSKTLPRVILPHENTYPFLYHYFLALFPDKARIWAERLTGAFFDTLNTAIVYRFSVWLAGTHNPGAGFSAVPSMTAALYAFSPALLRIGSGPRAYNGSPRVMGQSLYLIHILCAILFLESGNYLCAASSVLAGALLIATAKFAVQVLVFFGLFLSLVAPVYALLVLLSFIASIAVTNGKTLLFLKGHIRHSRFYVRHVQRIFLHPHAGSISNYMGTLAGIAWFSLTLRFAKAAALFFTCNHPLHLLVFVNPHFLLLALFLPRASMLPAPVFFLLVIALAGISCFVLTKLKPFMFLGEGERYLEYALFPSCFLAALFLTHQMALFYGWLGFCIVSACYYNHKFFLDYKKSNSDFAQKAALFKRCGLETGKILWPIGSHHYETLYLSSNRVLMHGANVDGTLMDKETFMLVYGNYPYPSANWRDIINRFRVDYIVAGPEAMEHYTRNIVSDPESLRRVLRQKARSETLTVFEIREDPHPPSSKDATCPRR